MTGALEVDPKNWVAGPPSRVSIEAQGLWLRMQFIMHESGRYGHLCNVKGVPLQDDAVAERCGLSTSEYTRLLTELNEEVICRNRQGVIFDPDMIANKQQREDRRKQWRDSQQRRRQQSVNNDTPSDDVFVLTPTNSNTSEEEDHSKAKSIPDWVPLDAWEEYLKIRKTKKAPNTTLAIQRLINKLTALRASGHDPREVILDAIEGGWKSFYERNGGGNAAVASGQRKADATRAEALRRMG